MKNILIASLLLVASTAAMKTANAHPGHHGSRFNNQLSIAYQYPNQLYAATQWRLGNAHINLQLNPTLIAGFGWHPSVVAVIQHPNFVNYALTQPSFNIFTQPNFNVLRWRKNNRWRLHNNNGWRNNSVRVVNQRGNTIQRRVVRNSGSRGNGKRNR